VLYSTIFESKEQPKIVAFAIFISLTINLILNYSLIKYFLSSGPAYVLAGVATSTVISRITLLTILYFMAKTKFNLKLKFSLLKKPIFATLVMTIFLSILNKFFEINPILVLIEVILGAGIYFLVLIFTKGITREDLELIKGLYKK